MSPALDTVPVMKLQLRSKPNTGRAIRQQALLLLENLTIIQTLQKTEEKLQELLLEESYPEAIRVLLGRSLGVTIIFRSHSQPTFGKDFSFLRAKPIFACQLPFFGLKSPIFTQLLPILFFSFAPLSCSVFFFLLFRMYLIAPPHCNDPPIFVHLLYMYSNYLQGSFLVPYSVFANPNLIYLKGIVVGILTWVILYITGFVFLYTTIASQLFGTIFSLWWLY